MAFDKTRLLPVLSPERLGPYLHAARDDLGRAMVLCEQNQRLSEARYVPLLKLEIGLGNRVFHHEPILRMDPLERTHQDIGLILRFMDEELAAWNQTTDRFPALMAELAS